MYTSFPLRDLTNRKLLSFVLLTAILLCLGTGTHGQLTTERGKAKRPVPKMFDSLGGKRGCCSGEIKNSGPDIFGAVEYEAYELAATYYSLDESLTATLMLNNKGPEPILATPTFYSPAGTRLRLAPITVPAASYIDVDMRQLLAEAGPEFREGSVKISYQGTETQLGSQVRLVDQQNSLIWAEQMVYPATFASNRLEGVWWLPLEDAGTKFVVSNTTYSPITVTIKVDGTMPQQNGSVTIQLGSSETRVLDIMRDLVGDEGGHLLNRGGISITHTGGPGAVLARMFVGKANTGFSSSVGFIDPELTASRKWHGNGLRLRNLNGEALKATLIARNTNDHLTTIRGKIPYTKPDGEMGAVTIPNTPLPANSTRVINLHGLMTSAGLPQSVTYAGIELEYDAPKGTVITSVLSTSTNGNHVFQVPMFDPGRMPSSAGGFPWKADGDFRTLVYIKNETEEPRRFTVDLLFEGGSYGTGLIEIKPSETKAIDFRQIRDDQTPDVNANVIPLNLEKGQIAWSVSGNANKTLSGRSDQISVSKGVASTYSCSNCCPNAFYAGWLEPGWVSDMVGGVTPFVAMQQDTTCFQTETTPYQVFADFWDSTNWSVANVGFDGTTTAVGAGFANVQASWEGYIWYNWGGGFCEPWPQAVNEQAPIEVINVTITRADGSALPSPFKIGINGGGNNRKQTLKATVAPANQAANITIHVSSNITLSNVQTSGGVITFDVVGATQSEEVADSTITAKRGSATLTVKSVSVVVPKKIATPHDTVGTYSPTNRVLDANTSPPAHGLPSGHVLLVTMYSRFLTIVVTDQFGDTIGDIYSGANITETRSGQTRPINQQLNTSGVYYDYVGTFTEYGLATAGSSTAKNWPSQPLLPMVAGTATQNIAVQVDGFSLDPAVVNRTWTAAPPNSLTVVWPN